MTIEELNSLWQLAGKMGQVTISAIEVKNLVDVLKAAEAVVNNWDFEDCESEVERLHAELDEALCVFTKELTDVR